MVTAQASLRGSCSREYEPTDEDQIRRSGAMGTVTSGSVVPLYESNLQLGDEAEFHRFCSKRQLQFPWHH